MPRLTRSAPAAATLAAALLSGCHTYVPRAAPPPVGREVRVTLTEEGSVAVAALVGPRVAAIDGRLTARDDSTVSLAVTSTTRRNGVEDPWSGEPVVVRRAAVNALEERVFSGRRTAVAAAITAGALAAVYAIVGGITGGSRTGPGASGGGGGR